MKVLNLKMGRNGIISRHYVSLKAVSSAMTKAMSAFVMAAGILCSSCVKNELSQDADKQNTQLKFCLIPVKTQTKSVTVSKFPEDETFGTCAWYLPSGKSWSADASSAVSYIGEEEISCQSSVWKAWASGQIYWWPQVGTLTFYSWSPFSLKDNGLSVSNTSGFSISSWTMQNTVGYGCGSTDDGCVDILLAQTTDCAKTVTGAPVNFGHKLCKVRVIATLAKEQTESESTWKIKSVTISNVYTEGSFLTDKWATHSEAKDYTYTPDTEVEVVYGSNAVIFPETMMLPQYMTEDGRTRRPIISITCTDANGEEKTLAAQLYNDTASGISAWNVGKYITYLITIGEEDSYIEFDANAGDWNYDSGEDINIGIVS